MTMKKFLVASLLILDGAYVSTVSAQDPAVSGGGATSDGTVVGAEVSGGFPVRYVERPLTLRQRTLRVDVAPSDFGLMDSGMVMGPIGPFGSYGIRPGSVRSSFEDPFTGETTTVSDSFTQFGAGASYGVTDQFEAGVLLLPVHSGYGRSFGNISLYGRYAFLTGNFSMGVQGTVGLPTYEDFTFGVGLPINVVTGSGLRIETGVEGEFIVDVDDDSGTFVNVDVPLAISVGIGDGFVGGRTGVTLVGVDEDLVYVNLPIGAQGGYSLVAGPTLIDLKASFVWNLEIDEFEDESSSYWYLMFGANAHFDL